MVLLALFDVVDDTKILQKIIIDVSNPFNYLKLCGVLMFSMVNKSDLILMIFCIFLSFSQ